MKIISFFVSSLLLVSCVSGKEKIYTASTPAGPVIRSFLGISLSDSIDFIRWRIMIGDDGYRLQCNYGIGKPNTDGFINGGKKIDLGGELKKEKNLYTLWNGDKTLKLAELNADLLHFLDRDNSMLVGNGGWSYTLNNSEPSVTDQINITGKRFDIKDSISFQGRTPCNVPGVIAPGMECYKLKWWVILYPGEKNDAGFYKLYGTRWREEGGLEGKWEIITGKNGRIIYRLSDEKGNGFLYLLKLDGNILVFTDAEGKLLVGNKDFSYTLNRI